MTHYSGRKDPAHVKQALEWLQKEANEKYCKEVKDTDGKSEAKDEREFFKTQKKFHAAVNKFSKEMDKVKYWMRTLNWLIRWY